MKLLKKLIGNELFKHYSSEKNPFLKCGFNNIWSVYNATHKERKTQVCIFIADKKSLKKMTKNTKELIFQLKKSSTNLAKFKHPNMLSLVEQVAEDKNSIGFITEKINYSLSTWVEAIKPSKLEIKSILIEIIKSLQFLHEDAHCIHNNLSPDTIFIDENNKIKLGAMEFSINDPEIEGVSYSPEVLLQNLSYVAPELIYDNKSFYTSDVYSIGLIAYNLLKYNKGENDRELLPLSSNTVDFYKTSFSSIDMKLGRLFFEFEDNAILQKCLIKNPQERPQLKSLLEEEWFNDPKLKALNFIEHLDQNEKAKNVEFLQKLPKILGMFENKVIIQRILPSLLQSLKVDSLVVPCLPAIFAIAENEEFKIDFDKTIWPSIKGLFTLKSMSASGLYFILSKIKFIASKISNQEFTAHFLNVICKAMDCNVAKIQSVVSDNLSEITKKIDSLSFKNMIYPRIIQILLTTNSNSLKVQLLNSIKSFYGLLNQNIINDNLLTNLDKIRKGDNSPKICMLIAEIYQDIAKVVSVESIANKILPNLISILVNGNISRRNFDSLLEIVHKYLDRIKKDREKDLFDDNNGDNVQTEEIIQQPPKAEITNDKEDFLSSFFRGQDKKNLETSSHSVEEKIDNNLNIQQNKPKEIKPISFEVPNTNLNVNNTPQEGSFDFNFNLNSQQNNNNNNNTNQQQSINIHPIVKNEFLSSNNQKHIKPIKVNSSQDIKSIETIQNNKQVKLDSLLDDLSLSKTPPSTNNQQSDIQFNFNTNMNSNVNQNRNTNAIIDSGFNQLDLNFLKSNSKQQTSNTNQGFNFQQNTQNQGVNFDFGMNMNTQTKTKNNNDLNLFNFSITNTKTNTNTNSNNNNNLFNF